MRKRLLLLLLVAFAARADETSIAWQVREGARSANAVAAADVFDAAAVSWTGAPATVRIRVSPDRARWSEWTALALDGDMTDESSSRYFSAIARFDGPQRFVEYAFSEPARDVTLTLFRPSERQARLRPASDEMTLGAVPVRSRVDWGCPDGETSRWTPAYTTVTHAVVHHTAGSNSAVDWDTEVRNIWYYHTLTNGWGDIGYNFLIAPDGVVYEGRAGGSGAIGAHFSCRNTNTVGVSLLGTFTSVKPTDAALESLRAVLTELARRHGLDPSATVRHAPSGLMLPTIIGHRDGNVPGATCTITECPGDVVYSILPILRTDVLSANAPPAGKRRRAARP